MQNLIFLFYLFCLKFYGKNKRKHTSIIPTISLSNSKTSIFLTIVTKLISTQFSSVIRKQMSFYLKNNSELQAVQEPLGIAIWLNFINKTKKLEGEILELGVYKGGMTILSANLLQSLYSKKTIFACDSFSGIPYEDKFSNVAHSVGQFGDTSKEYVEKKIKKFKHSKHVTLIPGLFEDTLYQKLSKQTFSLVLLDCDVYDATKFALEFVFPRMTKNGIIMLDDYERSYTEKPLWGATKAIDEFIQKNNLKINFYPDTHIVKI